MSATSSTDAGLSAAPHVVVVAGPTATGKSWLAVKIANALDGIVINADSQQRYRDLPTLSARPTSVDMAGIPHKLFGDLGPMDTGSAAEWAEKAAKEISGAVSAGRLPVVVGGTGLYLRALMAGLIDIPKIPANVHAATEALLADIGHAAFHERLKVRDPQTAERLAPGDTHRLLRAWDVIEATGTPMSVWQAIPTSPPLQARYYSVVTMPDRKALYDACDTRFQQMVEAGATEEVRQFLGSGGALDMPVMKMLGARELAAYLAGTMTLNEAIAAAQAATRQYAKRQVTWFKHQFSADFSCYTQLSEINCDEILPNIRHWMLT